MNTSQSNNGHSDSPVEVDDILEGLRPRMRAARIRHVRVVGAALAVVPLLGLGAVAFGQEGSGESISVAAGGGEERESDPVDDEIGTDISESGEDAPGDGDKQDDEADDRSDKESDDGEKADGDTKPPEPAGYIQEVDMATYGAVKVKVDDGGVTFIEAFIDEPWEFVGAETNEAGDLVISVTDGESIKLITVSEGLWDKIHIRFDDFVVPTTTVKPEPKPEPRPEPIVDRIELEVSPAGWFVVEREGETLWAGNVNPNEGFDYDIIKAEGWKVHVVFVNDTHLFHGKAYISESGELVTETWTEEREIVAEPVYQWVEIPEVGAVQFKYYDGLMYVVAIEAFEGFGSYIYNEVGEESVKVDFEGEGQLWIVEAWQVEGVIQWSTAGPNP